MSDGLGGEAPHPVTTLYVGNLPSAVDEYTLMTSFQFFGQITNIQVRHCFLFQFSCLLGMSCFLGRGA